MAAPVAALSDAKPRDRSIEARRAARARKFERERLIVDYLNRGVPVAEIANRIGVTEKRLRALAKEILARRMPEAPEEFVAIQVSRLNEALLVAYGAMSPDNLKAVALVVRIVRALDRYHGLADDAGRASHGVRQDGRLSAGHGAPREASARPEAGRARPEMAPEPIEKLESALEETRVPAAPGEAVPARAAQAAVGGLLQHDESRSKRLPRAAPLRAGAETPPVRSLGTD